MSKYSVKKPFTVFVAVVLILVTGIVSYTKMTPDLFPNIDMPYVIVMTPYPGATPEKVEGSVTKPMEQTLATLSDIKEIQSISNSNYSMVVLEFENSVNMDTVSSDILQKINLVSGSWEDIVGTPTIMKLNPNMIPVNVAAVNYEGKDRSQLSAFVSDTLQNQLEGTAGVASITASGVLKEQVNVVISQKKIDKINQKILASIDSQLADAQNQLNGQKAKIDDGKSQIEKQKKKLEDGKKQLAEGKKQLNAAKEQLEASKDLLPPEQYAAQVAVLDENSKKLAATEKQLKEGEKKLNDTNQKLDDASSQLNKAQSQMDVQAAQARKSADIGESITTEMISGILKGQNFSMPAGYIEEEGSNYLVSVGDNISTEKQAGNLFLFDSGVDTVGKVYLKDVADVFISDNAGELYAKINGEDGVVLSFSKQSNYATANVCESIQDKFDELTKEYEGLQFTTLMNQGDYIHLVVDSIISSLLWGALFAVVILFLFLRSIKPTVITICSIPISLVFAVLLMYFSGISINLISMSGLAVSVGMLVDNSVVVIENTVRLRRQGATAAQAAVAGAKQVGAAITASTLTTICVFVPIIFTDGLTRQLFTDMALTVAYTLIASLIVAMTLVPALSSKLLKNIKTEESKLYRSLIDKYQISLRLVLRHKAPVLLLAVALLVGSVYFSLAKGFIFMPEMSSPQLQATLEMPKGASLEETKEQADEALKRIKGIKEIETVGAMLSTGGMGGMGGSSQASVSLYIMLDEKMERTSNDIAEDINKRCEDMRAKVKASGSSMGDFSAAMGGSGVSINVYSADLDHLQQTAKDISKKLLDVAGIESVESGVQDSDKEYHFTVKKTAAMKKGLTVAQVYAAIVDAMTYEDTATTVTWQDNEYDVVVSSQQKDALSTKDLRDLTLEIQGANGKTQQVKLSDIAELEEKETLKAINRDNQSRYLTVTGTLKQGYNITRVTSAAEEALKDYDLPEGTKFEFSGENESIMEAMGDLVLMLLLGIVFVYLIMVAQFQSLKSPFIIMFTIPLAFTGGLLALLIFGKEISVIAMIGMVMLTGIIVNNGIVLVDYINQLRASGMAKKDAIVEAGMTRMRPILMTSLTTILGLIVMAFGNSAGTDMMQPVALVCIGGLVYATLLTLYIVPAIYDIMNREKYHYVSDEDLELNMI
ncbi:efflux RND transporter permease subunit [Ihubacter sp. mB4P-1]|uniref:efflux RND transporter permease subunit n=1 Tax=Ihubacter sp. mB4P-1 TaxID=3242370 RepID=UPI00137A747C